MIVLDTHALIWWANGNGQLSRDAKKAIDDVCVTESGIVYVSTISAWEIAMLVNAGRLILTVGIDDWLDMAAAIEKVQFMPVDVAVGVESTRLPGDFHKDPADRMIVALARHLNVPLVTADAKIRAYKYVRSVW